jgi:hypothetical protein
MCADKDSPLPYREYRKGESAHISIENIARKAAILAKRKKI